MIVVARYLKGCKMLERYEGKLSRTVLRRGGAGNRFLLSLRLFFLTRKYRIAIRRLITIPEQLR
ncbi:MAG: hypothetical protein EF813_04915 [Methanosarcinales archaeon]|nr:MAG: hypothetical protein EF813_04915 [Methanosarcinales archaeon]